VYEEVFMSLFSSPRDLFDIKGKVALVAGASGAFGNVASQILAGAGCDLVLAAGNAEALSAVSDSCTQLGARVTQVNRRPATEADCNDMINAAVEAYGRLDILVVASGMNKVAKIDAMAPATFTDVMDANVTQSWLLARAASTRMKAQIEARDAAVGQSAGESGGSMSGGKIVLVSSARGLLGHPAGYTAYCASKSAVDGMTKALGCELGPLGITVNAIAPTVFRSPLTAWMFEDNPEAKKVRAGFLARVPVGRLGEPEDLAGPLLFLSSRASDFYTGHILYADGGYTAG
jgi:NAD(P)-dependent dehydrogenase (short-subunit alcohol dehydrogenase family)